MTCFLHIAPLRTYSDIIVKYEMFVLQKFTTNLTFQGSSLIGELISIIFNFGEREEVFYWIIRNITYFMFGSTANNIFFPYHL